jgi:hypothetical protein
MSRNAALRGNDIELTAIFLDAAGDYADPSGITLSIYPPGKDPRNAGVVQSDAWVYGITQNDPGAGPYVDASETIEKIDTGRYKYTFNVPADADLGAAFDRWQGTVDLQALDETFSFTVVGGGSIGTTVLYQNNVVFVKLANTIAATDGSLLADANGDNVDYTYYFTTTYNPLYSSVRRIRLELGKLIANVPDDTINFAIFEASLEAAALSFGSTTENSGFFQFARRQFVTCVAEILLLMGVGAGGGDGKSKRLADLDVSYRGSNTDELLNRALKCRARWEATLTSAGALGPGVSQKPKYAIKGYYDPDRPLVGRGWEPTSSYQGSQVQMPAANIKSRYTTNRRWRRDYKWPDRFGGYWDVAED